MLAADERVKLFGGIFFIVARELFCKSFPRTSGLEGSRYFKGFAFHSYTIRQSSRDSRTEREGGDTFAAEDQLVSELFAR